MDLCVIFHKKTGHLQLMFVKHIVKQSDLSTWGKNWPPYPPTPMVSGFPGEVPDSTVKIAAEIDGWINQKTPSQNPPPVYCLNPKVRPVTVYRTDFPTAKVEWNPLSLDANEPISIGDTVQGVPQPSGFDYDRFYVTGQMPGNYLMPGGIGLYRAMETGKASLTAPSWGAAFAWTSQEIPVPLLPIIFGSTLGGVLSVPGPLVLGVNSTKYNSEIVDVTNDYVFGKWHCFPYPIYFIESAPSPATSEGLVELPFDLLKKVGGFMSAKKSDTQVFAFRVGHEPEVIFIPWAWNANKTYEAEPNNPDTHGTLHECIPKQYVLHFTVKPA